MASQTHICEQNCESQIYLIGANSLAVTGDVAWILVDHRWVELRGRLAAELGAYLNSGPEARQLSLLKRIKLPEAEQVVRLLDSAAVKKVVPSLLSDRPSLLFLELTDRCNLRCRHCYVSAGPESGIAMEKELALAIIEEMAELKFERLQLTGGEPVLHPELARLAEFAFERGMKDVEVFTNGTLLTRSMIEQFPGETRFALSFYSSNSAVHDRITGIEGSGAKTLATIELLRKLKFRVRISSIIMEENADDWPKTLSFLLSLGLSPNSIRAASTMGVGRGAYFPLPAASAATCVDEPEGQNSGDDDRGDQSISSGKVAVSASGDVFPCIFARWLKLGNRNQRSLADILARPDDNSGYQDVTVPMRWQFLSERLSCLDCRLLAFALMGQGR